MRHHFTRPACGILLAAVACLAAPVPGARAQTPAAVGSALDQILTDLATWDGGLESAAYWKLRDHVRKHADDPAARTECETSLVIYLTSPATPSARQAASEVLRAIASERTVPGLAALLADDRVSDYAIYALQPIPGPAADQALVQALASSEVSVATKTAIVAALGERASAEAVPALAALLRHPQMAKAAAIALGRIGDARAAQALIGAFPAAAGDLKPVVAASVLRCADRALAARDLGAARGLYDVLAADPSLDVPLRRAVAMGRIAAAGSEGAAVLSGYLDGQDDVLQDAAIARLRETVAPAAIAPVCARLPGLPESSQVKLLAVLASYPGDRVLPAILAAARSASAPVRAAAIEALASTGGPSEVLFLAQAAATARGAEQALARTTLGALKGGAVDKEIVALAGQGQPEATHVELLAAIADRRIYAAKGVVAAAISSPSPRVRRSALRAIRPIGTPSDIPAALDLFARSEDEMERDEAGNTVAALAQKIADPARRATAIRSRLETSQDPGLRARYLGLLPQVGDDSTLPLLRRALEDDDAGVRDAAVRALSAWPGTAARDDVLGLARDARDERHRLLAITGLVRIVTLDRYRDPRAAVSDLRQAASFSWRPEEQKLVLGALVQFPCREALELAASFERVPAVADEAAAAVAKLRDALAAEKEVGP